MHRFILIFLLFGINKSFAHPLARDTSEFTITILNEKQQPFEGASIELLKASNGGLVKAAVSDANGIAVFRVAADGQYKCNITAAGYNPLTTPVYSLPLDLNNTSAVTLSLIPSAGTLKAVTVNSKKPFIEYSRGRIIVNVDAAITNAGTTVLEVLEKSPGVMVDKNGTISLKAKQGVIVMIDDKQTYLSGTELAGLLGSMNSSQVDVIELITNPSAKYDASGNSGIINIKTKKNRQRGFNGTAIISLSQGVYSKNNDNLILNYRNGKFNTFLNYSFNYNKNFTDLYGYRRYLDPQGNVIAILDQPTTLIRRNFSNMIRTGIEFYASKKTTIGLSVNGMAIQRKGVGEAVATWKNAGGMIDSAVGTSSSNSARVRNGSGNINLKHIINKSQQLSIDIDGIIYDIVNKQDFSSSLQSPGGYTNGSRGDIPATIKIISAKGDYSFQLNNLKIESGFKASKINTDNLAKYQYYDGSHWKDDLGKSNHFLYSENIRAIYTTLEQKIKKFSFQAGLRYEHTHYDAHQLGNALKQDSAFSKSYRTFFPSGYVSYEIDSSHTFTFTAGRRIDRPPFQKLNPFIFIYNKYTHQRGNPYILPQFTWNFELGHQYKQLLTTTISYSILKNYFSQLFLTDTSDILIYSDGNVGQTHNLGISMSVQASPVKWWSFTATALMNYKRLKGFLENNYASSIRQLNFNLNNQFNFGKIYTAELSGFYTTRARNDIQELLYPTGQLSAGISRPVLKKKATLRFTARDILGTQAMEGLTQFQSADEYFIVRYDTRVFNVAFTYRFGKPLKAARRNQGGATDEMERVGTGN